MSERSRNRKPATFKLDDANVVVTDPNEESRPARGTVHVTPENDAPQLPVVLEPTIVPAEPRFRWGTLFWSALGGLVLLGAGLGVAHLIEDLFARSESLGVLGLVLTFAATLVIDRGDRARGDRPDAAFHDRRVAPARGFGDRERRS